MAKKGRRATEEERIRAVQLMESGKPPNVVAEILGVSRSSVFAWQKSYRAGGLAALSTKFASGRPTSLSDKQMLTLYSLIAGNDPRQLSFGMALWTRKMIAELISRQFGVRLSLVSVGRILNKLGMSAQRPVYRAYQQNPVLVEKWKAETYPQIRAEAAETGASIFFADEAAVRTDHHAGTTWAPVGQTPVVAATGERKSVSMISAVSQHGEIHFDVFYGTVNAERFIEFCKKLLQDCAGPVFLVVDGSSTHTAKKVGEYVATTQGHLKIFILPPYSPELNPDEWVWKNVKHDQIGPAVPMGQSHLWSLANDALLRLRAAAHIVRGFFADPHLSYLWVES
jgi:transposase